MSRMQKVICLGCLVTLVNVASFTFGAHWGHPLEAEVKRQKSPCRDFPLSELPNAMHYRPSQDRTGLFYL